MCAEAFRHGLCLLQRRGKRSGEPRADRVLSARHFSFSSVSFSLPSSTSLLQKKTKQHSLFSVLHSMIQSVKLLSPPRIQSCLSLRQEEYRPERRLREPRDATACRTSSLPLQGFLRHAYGRTFSVMLTYMENILRLT